MKEEKLNENDDDNDNDGDGYMDDADFIDAADKTFTGDNISTTSTPMKKIDKSVLQYLKMFRTKKQNDQDNAYGVRKLAKRIMIGDSQIHFVEDQIYVGDKTYKRTPGSLELLFKKLPDPALVNDTDENNYIKIVTMTIAHRKHYKADKSISVDAKSAKYKSLIAQFVGSSRKSGKGSPNYKIAREDGQEVDNVYWDNQNDIVDRLRLLLASQAAGNTNHANEIVAIIEELREAGIVH